MDKKTFLAELHPLPAGYSGSITIRNPEAHFASGVAILSYDADESETVFGQALRARYHMTDTWLYRHGKWQIAASQTLRYYEDPNPGVANESTLNDYVGNYELAAGKTMIVTRRDGKLFVKRGTGADTELLPESGDLFFQRGVEGRILFHRNSTGRVDSLISRRNNEDLIWKRILP